MEIGCDLVAVDELAPILARERSRRLVFTAHELALADALAGARRTEFLAGRFCAKEAVVKLLGTGFVRGVWWHDVEIRRHRSGQPRVVLHGGARRAARRRRIGPISLALTHQRRLVIAVAVAARTDGGRPA